MFLKCCVIHARNEVKTVHHRRNRHIISNTNNIAHGIFPSEIINHPTTHMRFMSRFTNTLTPRRLSILNPKAFTFLSFMNTKLARALIIYLPFPVASRAITTHPPRKFGIMKPQDIACHAVDIAAPWSHWPWYEIILSQMILETSLFSFQMHSLSQK